MNKQIVRIVIWAAVAIAVGVVVYVKLSRNKVNSLIDEANALIAEGDAARTTLGSQANQLLTGFIPREFYVAGIEPKNAAGAKQTAEDVFAGSPDPKDPVLDRAKLDMAVSKADGILATVVEKYRAAAAKFEEGHQASNSAVVSQYLDLMSQAYKNRADSEDADRKALALLADKSIHSEKELRDKQAGLLSESSKLNNEFERLDEQAGKLRNDNKGMFK